MEAGHAARQSKIEGSLGAREYSLWLRETGSFYPGGGCGGVILHAARTETFGVGRTGVSGLPQKGHFGLRAV